MPQKHRKITNGKNPTATTASMAHVAPTQTAQPPFLADKALVRQAMQATAQPSGSARQLVGQKALVQVCGLVDDLHLGGYPQWVVEEAKSKMKAKLCERPKCLQGFRGNSPLPAYLHVSLKRMCSSVCRKESHHNGGVPSHRNPAARHVKRYHGFGDGSDARHLGVRAVIATALLETSFDRPCPTVAGRPTSLCGAVSRGLLDVMREIADVVIECAHGRVAADDGNSREIVAELRRRARNDAPSCLEVASEGFECLMGLCEACGAKFEDLGSKIRANAKRELHEISEDLAAIAPIVNQAPGMVATTSAVR